MSNKILHHIVFYSGGIGSWAAAKRVVEMYGVNSTKLLFTDTLIEDEDLYRFLRESSEEIGAELIWLKDGRTPWEVFWDEKYLGNSRIAHCSKFLKQKVAQRWVTNHYYENECKLYIGIDWTEEHRLQAAHATWWPYKIFTPLCEPPYKTKPDLIEELEQCGIKPPRLYEMGFPHNNCGGFCCKAGQAQFANLLKHMPERYRYHEDQEQLIRGRIGLDRAMLKRIKKRKPEPLTLLQLRTELEQGKDCDKFDWGGCGCFL